MSRTEDIKDEQALYYSKRKIRPPFEFFIAEYPKDIRPIKEEPVPKKRKGFFVILFRILATLLIIAIVFLSAYMVVAGSPQHYQEDGFQIGIGNFGVNPVWMPDASSKELNGIFAQMEQKGALNTAYEMYVTACKKLNLSPKYSIRAIGNITTNAAWGDVAAMVKVNSNRLESYKVLGQPSLNANQPRIFSNMDINYPVESEGESLLVTIIQATAVESIRAYFDGEYVYEQRTKDMKQNEDGEFEMVWPNKYKVLEKDFERAYEDHELREKANFVINPDTIVPESVEIKVVNVNGVNRYDIYFELDCENTDLGSATYYEAEAIKRKMGQSQQFTFTYMDVFFSVYENGYMTHWTTNQQYRISQNLGPLGTVVINAHNYKREAISYDPEDCQIVNFLNNE
ncbi:MAG: hypothetical protein QM214_01955 [Bacillota bacterium]|jgi:hypothetical protein|nr:hypothetical protein [Bacillota bacterium]HHU43244.1 hypothetical protein [Clostridiales bacterium]